METALRVVRGDNEENGVLGLRIAFDLHKNFRPALESSVAAFFDFVVQACLS